MKQLSSLVLLAVLLLKATPVWGITEQPEEREVFFSSSDSAVTLAGTVAIPGDSRLSGMAVLLSVAGPTDRDGTLGPHQLYKSIAHALADKGVATLRFDARGVGKSGGNFLETDLQDRAGDACRALTELKKQLDADNVKAGFIGMSEGGGVGVLAASQCSSADFAVLLSTPVRTGKNVLDDQMNRMVGMSPTPEEKKQKIKAELTHFLELVTKENPEKQRDEIKQVLSGPYGKMILPPYRFVPKTVEGQVNFVLSPWYQSQLKYDIRETLSRSEYPLLGLYGGLDKVIDPRRNAELLKELRPGVSVEVLTGLNHLMQQANTGSPAEYASLPEAVSDTVTSRVGNWIRNL